MTIPVYPLNLLTSLKAEYSEFLKKRKRLLLNAGKDFIANFIYGEE